MKPRTNPILLITHTDRDGLLSGAALLRALGDPWGPEVLLTQGSYLASELEDLVAAGRRYAAIHVTDTYWHPLAATRIHRALRQLLLPGALVTWIDHHPSSVDHEGSLAAALPLSPQSALIGDRDGRYEAVSLVVDGFGLGGDAVACDLLRTARNGWNRGGPAMPPEVAAWLEVVDGLARMPSLPPAQAAQIVRTLAGGFGSPIPGPLATLGATTREVRRHTRERIQGGAWTPLPSTKGGRGLLLDLHADPGLNAYELAYGLATAAGGRVDYFVTQEAPGLVHYVSGPTARAERDALEGGMPHLRVATFYKVGRHARGIDLAYLTRRRPASAVLGPWIDAHPYLVKAPWRRASAVDGAGVLDAAEVIGATMQGVLERCRWSDRDRRLRRLPAPA